MKRLIMQNDKQTEWIENLKWKADHSRRCPSCSIFIHRDEGCNKVDCSLCGHTFCWECSGAWFEGCSYFVCKKSQSLEHSVDEAVSITVKYKSPSS